MTAGDRPSIADLAASLRAALEVDAGVAVVGLGWATVDLHRAAAELTAAFPEAGPFAPGPEERLLGANAWIGRPAPTAVVLLEPNTEGRLAATLARQGEGPAVLWVRGRIDGPLSAPRDGPFGRERLVLGGRLGGQHLLVVEGSAGTIDAR